MGIPKWLSEKDSTRKRSGSQENSLAKRFSGKKTPNSGAVFSENDLRTRTLDIEAKTTGKKSFAITEKLLDSIAVKSVGDRIPTLVIRFEQSGKEYAVIDLNYIEQIIQFYNENK